MSFASLQYKQPVFRLFQIDSPFAPYAPRLVAPRFLVSRVLLALYAGRSFSRTGDKSNFSLSVAPANFSFFAAVTAASAYRADRAKSPRNT